MAKSIFTWNDIRKIYAHPHLLGQLCGMKDLTELHSDWIKYIHDSKTDVALQASRGSFKSSSIDIIGIMYRLLRDPDETICLVRKNYTKAAEMVRMIMNLMESPIIHELFRFAWFASNTGDINTKDDWKFSTRKEGKIDLSNRKSHSPECSVEAVGMDTSTVGTHVDFCLMDDIVSVKDRLYTSERAYTAIMASELRGNIVKKTGYAAIIGTPYHREDYFSNLEAEGVPIRKYPYQVLPFISPEAIEKARSMMTPAYFSCNYELVHTNSNDMPFNNPVMGVWDRTKAKNILCHVDASYGGLDSTAITIMGDIDNGKICAVGFLRHEHIEDLIPFILQQCGLYNARRLCAEDNADKGFVIKLIQGHPLSVAYKVWCEGYTEHTNKQVKISTILYQKWGNIVWDEVHTDEEYMNQILDWTEVSKDRDDAPDSASACIREAGFSVDTDWRNLYK